MSFIERDTHCESKAEFAELLRRWYDSTDEKTIGDLTVVKGVTSWVTVRTGGRDFRVHADTSRDGIRRYLELVGLHGATLPWHVERSRSGKINKVCVEPDKSPTKGLFVYATGRSSQTSGPSELGRPETIEETGDLIASAGGEGSALVVDHEDPAAVDGLVTAIERDHGRLDVLVNDIFGGDRYMEWDKPLWEHDWAGGLRMLQMGVHTHLITCRAAIPLMLRTAKAQGTRGLVVEMTDGTSQANAEFRRNVGFYYDLVKANVERIVKGLTAELEDSPVTAVGVTPGWLRSEKMLENFGVSEANWRDAVEKRPGFGISESPTYVARGVAALATAADAERWSGMILSARQLADAYGFTDTDGSRPDCWGHLAAYGWDNDDGRGIDEFR